MKTDALHFFIGNLRRKGGGFSLIELMVVMAIVALLASLTVVAFQGIGASRKITTAGNMIVDQFMLARQTALTKNAKVRWQLVKVPDSRSGEAEAFRLIRLQLFNPRARSWESVGQAALLPVAITADPARSTLLQAGSIQNISDLTYDGQTERNAQASSVLFLENGRTSLNPNGVFTVTLHDSKSTNDFITVQIDPVSGRTRTYRP